MTNQVFEKNANPTISLLADLLPLAREELAERVGLSSSNLVAGLNGRRPIAAKAQGPLLHELGLKTEDRLDVTRVHHWQLRRGGRLANIETFKKVCKRLLREISIGPTLISEDTEQPLVTVLNCFTPSPPPLINWGSESETLDPIYICVSYDRMSRIELNPDFFKGYGTRVLFGGHRDADTGVRFPFGDVTISNKLLADILATPPRVSKVDLDVLIPNPAQSWTWDMVIYYAKLTMSPEEVAGRLDLEKEIGSEETVDNDAFGPSL